MESPTIGKLSEALAKAQGEMENAKKDSVNPHFKSKYADLASIIEAARAPLSKQGLSYVQYMERTEEGLGLITKLMHTSGEWISGCLPLIMTKQDMQGLGSAVTYARRYSLSCMLGIAQEDDDGNTATAIPDYKPVVKPKMPAPIEEELSLQKKAEGQKINLYKMELGITSEELKAEVFKIFGTDDFKALSLEQLKKVTKMLMDQKEKQGEEVTPEWLKEANEPLK